VSFVQLPSARIEYEFIRSANTTAPTIVFLHEGLGSLAMWKSLPHRLRKTAEASILVYSRVGHGRSTPLEAPRSLGYLEHEALEVLPQLLGRLAIRDTILFGHSDGASIALIFASAFSPSCRGLILLAPHVFVEDHTIQAIHAAKTAYAEGGLRERLSRYHDDADGAFRGWSDVWLDPNFRGWNIEARLPRITCPVLAIQGDQDPYGTFAHVDRIASGIPHAKLLKLSSCGHAPHWEQPRAVFEASVDFVRFNSQANH
jgi:pimeloyl-ACP methyl ester carboxylesterase